MLSDGARDLRPVACESDGGDSDGQGEECPFPPNSRAAFPPIYLDTLYKYCAYCAKKDDIAIYRLRLRHLLNIGQTETIWRRRPTAASSGAAHTPQCTPQWTARRQLARPRSAQGVTMHPLCPRPRIATALSRPAHGPSPSAHSRRRPGAAAACPLDASS